MGNAKLREFHENLNEIRVLWEHGCTTDMVGNNYDTGTNGNGLATKTHPKNPIKNHWKSFLFCFWGF